jgi:hypothetical protein
VRRRQPGAIVLAVDLPGGQNGYLLVGKLKKDEGLKAVPVIIVGNPEGFEAHARLKNRANEYLPKPLDIPNAVAVVARLSGASEETPLVLEEEATVSGDPDLDLIDAAFDDAPTPPPAPVRAAPPPPPAPARKPAAPAPRAPTRASAEEDFSELTAEEGPTVVQFTDPRSGTEMATGVAPEDADGLVLSPADVDPAEDAQARAFAAEVQAVQQELGEPLAGAREGSVEGDELMRLRSELHAAEQLVGDLRDQHAQAEQRELELRAELSRRDGQLKALQTRLDQVRPGAAAPRAGAPGRRTAGRRRDPAHAGGAAGRRAQRPRAESRPRRGCELQAQDMRERAEAPRPSWRAAGEQAAAGASPEELESLHAAWPSSRTRPGRTASGSPGSTPAEGRGAGPGEGLEGRVGREPAPRRDPDRRPNRAGRRSSRSRRDRPGTDEPPSPETPYRTRAARPRPHFSSFFGAFFLSSIFRASSCTPEGTFLFLARSFTSDSRAGRGTSSPPAAGPSGSW